MSTGIGQRFKQWIVRDMRERSLGGTMPTFEVEYGWMEKPRSAYEYSPPWVEYIPTGINYYYVNGRAVTKEVFDRALARQQSKQTTNSGERCRG